MVEITEVSPPNSLVEVKEIVVDVVHAAPVWSKRFAVRVKLKYALIEVTEPVKVTVVRTRAFIVTLEYVPERAPGQLAIILKVPTVVILRFEKFETPVVVAIELVPVIVPVGLKLRVIVNELLVRATDPALFHIEADKAKVLVG